MGRRTIAGHKLTFNKQRKREESLFALPTWAMRVFGRFLLGGQRTLWKRGSFKSVGRASFV